MLKSKSLLACAMAATMTLGLSACSEDAAPTGTGTSGNTSELGTTASTSAVTTIDPNELASTDAEIKDVSSDSFTPDGNSGKIVWLGYYDLMTDGSASEQYKIFTSETYGGEIEYVNSSDGAGYFEKLGSLISADDSPDIVRYEWLSFPMGMGKNMYESVDDLIDIETPLWEDMSEVIEDFVWQGKHYYLPYRISTNFAINYNRKVVIDAGLTDPYDLYLKNEWTWDSFRDLMIQWCNLDDTNIGYCGVGSMSFIATTGTPLIEVTPDGTILNNIHDPNVTRAMEFVSGLNRDGLIGVEEGFKGYMHPGDTWAPNSGRVLFLGMAPEWTYSAASGKVQNPPGVENDVCGVASDFAFLPFPRDPSSDTYNIAYDTFGYLIPKGAKNKKGAADWIQLNRVYQTDEGLLSTAREDAINPKPVYYTAGDYEGKQKWALVWDERVYDVWQDMMDPTKFNLVFDSCYGFSDEMTALVDKVLNGPMLEGDSWAQVSGENESAIDSYLEEYR